MARTKGISPVTAGAIGAAAGAVIGGATSVLLTNKSARRKIASRLKDIGEYAEQAMNAASDVAKDNQFRHVRLTGVKGGKTKSRKRNSQK